MIRTVAAGLVNADPPPDPFRPFLARQGFEETATRVGVGHYRLFLTPLAVVDPLEAVVHVTPAVAGCLFTATLIDERTVDVAFTDAAEVERDAQFNVSVERLGVGPA